jgi:hypothetical protein
MSAMAMILIGAMIVPGYGPDKVSEEPARKQQPLDLKGQWKAVVYWKGLVIKGDAAIVDGQLQVEEHWNNHNHIMRFGKVVDEGSGNLQIGGGILGIYEQDGNELRICVGTHNDKSRPTSFRATEKQCLLILNLVKSGK